MRKKKKIISPKKHAAPQKPQRSRLGSLLDALNILRFDRKKLAAFCMNIVVGVATLFFFKFMEHSRWWDNIGNSGFDTLIYIESKDYAQKENQLADSPVFFIEIDDASYKTWKDNYFATAGAKLPLPATIKNACAELPFTPRAQLGRLIDKAWKANASLVLLDVVLDSPDPCDPEGDKELRQVLENMRASNASTHVAFPALTDQEGRLKKTILDDVLDNPEGPRIFHRHSPQIVGSSIDSVYRFWSMFAFTHNEQGKNILWSSPVLASALVQNKLPELNELSEALLNAGQSPAKEFVLPVDEQIRFSLAATSQRKDDKRTPGTTSSQAPSFKAPERLDFQRIRFRLTPNTPSTLYIRQSAEKFLNASKDEHGQELKGKIVLIGATSREKNDHHVTPAGELPGVYILGNAVFSITKGLIPRHLSALQHYSLELVVIVIAAYAFLYFNAGVASMITNLFFLLMLAPISWFLFDRYGIFLNFMAPIVGMGLHKTFVGFENLIKNPKRTAH